jgi:membrane protease YdiL (CAAX protease family)
VRRVRRFPFALAGVIAVLVTLNLLNRFGPPRTGLVLGPAVALGLVVFARRHGLSWDDLGMSRRAWASGAVYAAGAAVLVTAGYLIGAALPSTRSVFLDVRYQLHLGAALVTALVVIPFGTVLTEEVAFRGVLHGLVRRRHGTAWATLLSSVLFGLWHVLPSRALGTANQAVGATFGSGAGARAMVVVAAVAFTALAGVLLCELRRRSGSLLAAAGLHWATNSVGVLVAAALWTIRGA